jgi:hypothetical protein
MAGPRRFTATIHCNWLLTSAIHSNAGLRIWIGGFIKSIIIKENVIHQLDPNGSVQLIIYLDAESEIAKTINLNYLSGHDIFRLV